MDLAVGLHTALIMVGVKKVLGGEEGDRRWSLSVNQDIDIVVVSEI